MNLLLSLLCFSISVGAQIRLGTALMPPYQKETSEGIQGTAVNTVLCVFDKTNREPTITVMPSSRLAYSLNHSESDAIFSLGKRVPRIGIISRPIVLEKWYWFYNNNDLEISPSNKELIIAVVRGSESEYWLKQQRYKNLSTVSIVEQAIKMLEAGRVDAILADNLKVQEAALELDIDVPSEFSVFQKFTSLGMHFSDTYVDENPAVVVEFNNNIRHCNPTGIHLDKADTEALLEISKKIRSWLNSDAIKKLLAQHTSKVKPLTKASIKALDQQWRSERESNVLKPNDLISQIYNTSLSNEVRAFKIKNGNLFSEIIITDKQGLNIGISDIPSDYWQGDEEKYMKTVQALSLDAFIDRIKFDSSSSTFQSQVSLSILGGAGDIIGMVTIGINVEAALKSLTLK